MDAGTAARIVERALETEVELESCYRPRSGSVAETCVCRLEGGENSATDLDAVVCKRGGASVWTGDVIEPLVCDLVGQATDLPVPGVLASGSLGDGTGGPRDPRDRWALYEYLPGTNPRPRYLDLEPPVRRRLVADAGAMLGRLHDTAALSFDRVGGLARSPRANGSELVRREPDGWHALESDFLERVSAPISMSAPANDACRPVLTHGDYQPCNLLVDDRGAITGVLDWGNAHVTCAEYALARAEARFVEVYAGRLVRAERRRLRRTFRRAYADHAPLESGFDRRAPGYKLLWVAQSSANYLRIARRARGRRQLRRQVGRLLE